MYARTLVIQRQPLLAAVASHDPSGDMLHLFRGLLQSLIDLVCLHGHVCMYVSLHVCMSPDVYIQVCLHVCVCVYARMFACMYVCVYACVLYVNVRMHALACMYVRMYIYIYIYEHTFACHAYMASLHTCISALTYVNVKHFVLELRVPPKSRDAMEEQNWRSAFTDV
jgi:hypothetical protein